MSVCGAQATHGYHRVSNLRANSTHKYVDTILQVHYIPECFLNPLTGPAFMGEKKRGIKFGTCRGCVLRDSAAFIRPRCVRGLPQLKKPKYLCVLHRSFLRGSVEQWMKHWTKVVGLSLGQTWLVSCFSVLAHRGVCAH